jgi:uncharacterized protein YndB with AHSA1/START domain
MTIHTFDPGPLAEVEHHVDEGRSTLVFTRHVRHPPVRVWTALTDPAYVRQWAPFDPDRDLGTTGPATLRMTDGATTEQFAVTITRAAAPERLDYTWGNDVVRWELVPEESGTRLTLRHTVAGPEWVSRTAAGWHLCLLVAERLLDGDPIGRIVGEDAKRYGWDALYSLYSAKLGIPIATPHARHAVDTTRAVLRHLVATLAYRAAKVLRDPPAGFDAATFGPATRTPTQIVAHMADLIAWGVRLAQGDYVWKAEGTDEWGVELRRFFDGLASLDRELAAEGTFAGSMEKLIQGPLADALTHVGQLAMLRGMAGSPIRPESYARADIVPGRVGLEQAAPVREFSGDASARK